MDEERSELEDLTAGYIARGEAEGLASDAQGIADRAWDEGAHDGMGDVATPDLPPAPRIRRPWVARLGKARPQAPPPFLAVAAA